MAYKVYERRLIELQKVKDMTSNLPDEKVNLTEEIQSYILVL